MTIQNFAPPNEIATSLKQYFNQYQSYHEQNSPENLQVEFDSDWPSLCYMPQDSIQPGEHCRWQLVAQDSQDMFERLADVLQIDIHPDIIHYFSSFWSNHLPATSPDGDLELLQVWNQEDMERLRSNLLGHALDKQRRKHDLSFFFAVTTSEEGMLCINNNSGEIWFEIPGKKPKRKISHSLNAFLQSLKPR